MTQMIYLGRMTFDRRKEVADRLVHFLVELCVQCGLSSRNSIEGTREKVADNFLDAYRG